MNLNLLLAEADLAIERNRAMTSGSGKYRADHHAELVTICTMLRDELKEIRAVAKHGSTAKSQEQADSPEEDYTALNAGIIRSAYRMRSSG